MDFFIRARHPSLAALIVLAALSCSTAELTQIVVVVETDYPVPAELAQVRFEAQATADIETTEVLLIGADAPTFPLTLTYVPEGAPDSPLRVTVTGLDASGLALVAQSRSTRFLIGESLTLRMTLSQTCVSVSCADGETCVSNGRLGRCEAQESAADTLPPFVAGLPSGGTELCNDRDDDQNGPADDGFDFANDPLHCGSCFNRCPSPDTGPGEPNCVAGRCALDCPTRRADCNSFVQDGCEGDVTTGEQCGTCGSPCPATAPQCDEQSGSYVCIDGCMGNDVLCGTSCVDIQSDADHCGGCQACPDPGPLGSVSCEAGECIVRCDDQAHVCEVDQDGIDVEVCLDDNSLLSCGDRCEPCDLGATAVCERQGCFLECPTSRLDCSPTEPGCETRGGIGGLSDLGSQPNCGGCGVSCGSGTCQDFACSRTVVDFEIGPRHVCAQLSDETFWCWGANESGQSGQPETEPIVAAPSILPFNLVTGRRVAHLDDRTSYFRRALSMGPFGQDHVSIVGLDPSGDAAGPIRTPDGERVIGYGGSASRNGIGLSLGVPNSQNFLAGTASLWGWGGGPGGASAVHAPFCDGDECASLPESTEMVDGIGPNAADVGRLSIARGIHETCAELVDGELSCWGVAEGEPVYIGNGLATGSSSQVVINPMETTFVSERFNTSLGVAFGDDVGCATFEGEDGVPRLYCWGDWDCGPYGLSPTRVPGALAGTGRSITVADSAACATHQPDGAMVCWGNDVRGGACRERAYIPFPQFAGVTKVRISNDFGCLLLGSGADEGRVGAAGALYCWGNNAHGQLGVGEAEDAVFPPRQVVFDDP
ncbi:MAG: hypothetical protein AB8I08_29115 [Sandaracinaceae bacterium]